MTRWVIYAYESMYGGLHGYNSIEVFLGDYEADAELAAEELAQEIADQIADQEYDGDYEDYESSYCPGYILLQIKDDAPEDSDKLAGMFYNDLHATAQQWVIDYQNEFHGVL